MAGKSKYAAPSHVKRLGVSWRLTARSYNGRCLLKKHCGTLRYDARLFHHGRFRYMRRRGRQTLKKLSK